MKKFVCPVCGYSVIAEAAPEKCPVCGVPGSKFKVEEVDAEMTWAAEHVAGVAKDVDPEIKKGLVDNFNGECCEVGMYLAMARVLTAKVIPKSVCITKKPLGKKRNTPQNLRNFWAKSSPTALKRIWNFASRRKTAQPQAKPNLQAWRKSKTLTQFTTPFTKWRATKPVTAKPSRDFTTVTSKNNTVKAE